MLGHEVMIHNVILMRNYKLFKNILSIKVTLLNQEQLFS